MEPKAINSGIAALDQVLKGLRLGDNVVWQVDSLDDYSYFAEPFADQAIRYSDTCVYLRFAPHPPIVGHRRGLVIKAVDPSLGFDSFTAEVHRVIEQWAKKKFFILDNLSALVEEWATDELLANFFQVTCPFLRELDTIAYFALTRGQHAHSAVARVRDTTQVLIDVYRIKGRMYIHPLKVWDRYSPQMFLPHVVTEGRWQPVFQSGEAAAVSAIARKRPLHAMESSIAPWDSVYNKLIQYREADKDSHQITPEVLALKEEFSRMMIGNHPEFNRLADSYFTLEDLYSIRDRMIGSGRIGGKAAGMLVARRILLDEDGEVDFSQILEDHDSFYIGSDVFFTFLVHNNLFRLRLKLSRNSQFSREEFEEVEQSFLTGRFSAEIMEQFRS
ncbi:MAG: PEP/pyruvate-binding domain-containing protein, partial [Deltaproteobacteria bacterium]|nr:PEP/pyruvate-binding domain-containing protein [Deltaproteobacteria bacterium]